MDRRRSGYIVRAVAFIMTLAAATAIVLFLVEVRKTPGVGTYKLKTFREPVNSVSFSPDGTRIFAVYWASSIWISDWNWQPEQMKHFCSLWDVKSQQRLRTELREDAGGNRHDGAFATADGMMVTSWLWENVVYDEYLTKMHTVIHLDWEAVQPITCFLATGKVAVLAGDDTVRYSAIVGRSLQPWSSTPPINGITRVAFGTTDSRVLVGTKHGSVMEYQLAPFAETYRLSVPGVPPVFTIAPVGLYHVAFISASGSAYVIDRRNNYVLHIPTDSNRDYNQIAASTSGKEFAASFVEKSKGRYGVTALSIDGRELITTMTESNVTCIKYSTDDTALAAGQENGTIVVWQ